MGTIILLLFNQINKLFKEGLRYVTREFILHTRDHLPEKYLYPSTLPTPL